jgi:hypothetical protein
MSNVLKSQRKIAVGQLIENQLLVALAGPTPPVPGQPARRARDPRGGLAARLPLPLGQRTCIRFGAEGGRA